MHDQGRDDRSPGVRTAERDRTDAPERDGVPWGVIDAVGVLVVTAVVSVALLVAVAALAALQVPPEALVPVLMPLPLVALGVVTLAWVHLRYRAAGRLTGPGRASLGDWVAGLGWGIAAFLAVNITLALVLQALTGMFGVELPQPQEGVRDAAADPMLVPWLLLSVAVVAPLAEEVFFRGLLHQALRRRLRAWSAIAVSAVAFAAAHVIQELGGDAGPLVFVMILPVGLLIGWLFERRETLAVPVAAHAAYNLATVGLLLVAM